MNASTWYGTVNEDGTFSILARICDLAATGKLVRPGEGPCLVQADLTSITCEVWDLGKDKDNDPGSHITPNPGISPLVNIYDTLQTLGWPVASDPDGYNFRHDVPPVYVATGDHWYFLKYKFTLTGGSIPWLRVKVKAIPTSP